MHSKTKDVPFVINPRACINQSKQLEQLSSHHLSKGEFTYDQWRTHQSFSNLRLTLKPRNTRLIHVHQSYVAMVPQVDHPQSKRCNHALPCVTAQRWCRLHFSCLPSPACRSLFWSLVRVLLGFVWPARFWERAFPSASLTLYHSFADTATVLRCFRGHTSPSSAR